MRAIGKFLWRFMVIFSFIVNFVLVAVLLVAGLYIFQIKAQVADPLIGGLHSTAAGLGDATIDWIIPVRDTVPVQLDVPINSNTIQSVVTDISGQPVDQQIPGETVVTLTRGVPISIVGANINAGNLQLTNATVNITLPAGTQLPVALDLNLALDTELPIALDVRAVIPLSETQLNDPIRQLGLLFEPLAIGLHNLPNNFSEAGEFAALLVGSDEPMGQLLNRSLLATDGSGFNSQAYDPWVGFSQTAGVGYESLLNQNFPAQARPIETGIVVPGGIPALDALLPDRANLYTDGSTPASVNDSSIQTFAQTGLPTYTYNGEFAGQYDAAQGGISQSVEEAVLPPLNTDAQSVPIGDGGTGGANTDPNSANTNNAGSGIIPTPTGN